MPNDIFGFKIFLKNVLFGCVNSSIRLIRYPGSENEKNSKEKRILRRFETYARWINWFPGLQEDIFVPDDNIAADRDSPHLTVYRHLQCFAVSFWRPREGSSLFFFSSLIYIHDFLAAETKDVINRERSRARALAYVKSSTHQRSRGD